MIQVALGLAGLPEPDVGAPARGLERPVVIRPAAGAALTVDRASGVNGGRTFAAERQLDVGVEISALAAHPESASVVRKKLIQATKIDRQAASSRAREVPSPPSSGPATLGGVRSLSIRLWLR